MRFIAHGSLVLLDGDMPGPRIIKHSGRTMYRFMDYLYVPVPPAEMDPHLVREVCELRLSERARVLDRRIHARVQAAMIDVVRDRGLAPGNVLDFGTGTGEAAETLRTELTPRVAGCDMSWASLAAARPRNAVAVAPQGPLPFASGTFDLVHALFVMHFKVPAPMLSELHRCTAPGGGYLVANCYGDSIEPYRERMRAASWGLAMSVPVTGVAGHVIDLWERDRRVEPRPFRVEQIADTRSARDGDSAQGRRPEVTTSAASRHGPPDGERAVRSRQNCR